MMKNSFKFHIVFDNFAAFVRIGNLSSHLIRKSARCKVTALLHT